MLLYAKMVLEERESNRGAGAKGTSLGSWNFGYRNSNDLEYIFETTVTIALEHTWSAGNGSYLHYFAPLFPKKIIFVHPNRQNIKKKSRGTWYGVAVLDMGRLSCVSVNHCLVGGKSTYAWQSSAPSSFRPTARRSSWDVNRSKLPTSYRPHVSLISIQTK